MSIERGRSRRGRGVLFICLVRDVLGCPVFSESDSPSQNRKRYDTRRTSRSPAAPLDPLQRTDPLDFHKLCPPGGRFDHLSGAQLIWLSILIFICPFLSVAPGTGKPVPHSASTPPTPIHHTLVRLPHLLHHFTTCEHSRCLRPYANLCTGTSSPPAHSFQVHIGPPVINNNA